MGKVISIANQKGGVGKTTTCINFGAYLAQLNYKVLIIDLDPQGSATTSLGVNRSNLSKSSYSILTGECSIKESILSPENMPELDLIPSNVGLSGVEVKLVLEKKDDDIQHILQPLIRNVKKDYDFILFDCPPSLGLLTINALQSSDSVLIPLQCQFLALDGLTQLINTVRAVQKQKRHNNERLSIEGVLLTMFDKKTKVGTEVRHEVKQLFQEKLFDNVIPMNVAVQNAPKFGLPLCKFEPKSKAAISYLQFTKEFLTKNG